MRQIEFFINGLLADFSDIEQLPLSMRKKTDAFTDIVGIGGVEIEQVFKTLSFPATNNNCLIFEADMLGSKSVKGNTIFYQLFVDGNKVSSGEFRLKTVARKAGKIHRFIVETVDKSLLLWEKLETVSLQDLNLGGQIWNAATIVDSWVKTVDDMNGIFAPVVYGKPTSETEPTAFHARDFRLSVYYIPILKAIFEKVGYTIESMFFDTEIMRNAVYLYSNGSNLKRSETVTNYQVIAEMNHVNLNGSMTYQNIDTQDSQNQFNPNTRIFTPSVRGLFSFNAQCRCVVDFSVNFKKNGIDNLFFVSTSDGTTKIVNFTWELLPTDSIEINLTTSGTLPVGEAMEADVQIDLKSEPILGSSISVASCLHNRPVKEFLRGVTHQFCAAWYVNEPLKKVYFEPRFEYYYDIFNTNTQGINRYKYNGFYGKATKPLDIDVADSQIDIQKPFGKSLILSYNPDSSDPIEKHLKGDGTGVPYQTKITFHDRDGKEHTNRNPYFSNLYMVTPQGVSGSIPLPSILPSSFKVGEVLNGTMVTTTNNSVTPPVVTTERKGEVTFEGSPKCGLVFRESVGIRFDNGSTVDYYLAPMVTQQSPYSSGVFKQFSLNYSNFKRFENADTVRGLVDLFFKKYCAIIRQGTKISVTSKVFLTDIIQNDFRKLSILEIDSSPTPCIDLEISDIKLSNGQTANFDLYKYTEVTSEDVEMTIETQIIAPVTPDTL